MAINPKIVKKIKEKTSEDSFMKTNIIRLLSKIEEGRQPKREIDKIINDIK